MARRFWVSKCIIGGATNAGGLNFELLYQKPRIVDAAISRNFAMETSVVLECYECVSIRKTASMTIKRATLV